MDRLFLDANILFSAAYRADAGLLDLWTLKNVTLCSSHYALKEARINLSADAQKERLTRLATVLEFSDAALQELPPEISLPEKDAPIMLAAIEARATHLLTGDLRHFGPYFGRKISGVLIVLPGTYLKSRSQKPKAK
jgi:predicted nucleic acid-binding protein